MEYTKRLDPSNISIKVPHQFLDGAIELDLVSYGSILQGVKTNVEKET